MEINGNVKVLKAALNEGFNAQALLIQGYRTTKGKLTDVILDTSAEYMKLVQASLAFCNVLNLRAISESAGVSMSEVELAMAEVKESLANTIERGAGNNPDYTHSGTNKENSEDTFEFLSHGVKLHKASGALHISGVLITETVREPGEYKEVKSAPKTIAKNAIRNMLPLSKLREYKLTAENIEQVTVGGRTFTSADFK